jgi:hypothetical protein
LSSLSKKAARQTLHLVKKKEKNQQRKPLDLANQPHSCSESLVYEIRSRSQEKKKKKLKQRVLNVLSDLSAADFDEGTRLQVGESENGSGSLI